MQVSCARTSIETRIAGAALGLACVVGAVGAVRTFAQAQGRHGGGRVTTRDAGGLDASLPPLRLSATSAIPLDAGGDTFEQPPAVASSERGLRSLLGRRIAEIQADAGPLLDGGGAWRPFRSDVFVQFQGDRVVRVTARVPPGTRCETAVLRFGFDHAMPPLRRSSACEWPPRSERHLLEPGLAARVDLTNGALEVWVVE